MEVDQFADIVRRHQAGVCAVAYGVTGDRGLSEDVAQDTFLAAWRGWRALRDPSRLRGWLHGIARNLAHKARRRRRSAAVEDTGDVPAPGDPVQETVARDEARVAWTALRALPARYREALVLYYWEDESARAVAQALGISEAAAMQRLSRGRALLRREIERQVEDALRRARPGASLTAAILAAIAAAAAGTASTAAATGTANAVAVADTASATASRWTHRLSRRAIWKAGLAVVALQGLGKLGARRAVLSGRRRGGSADRPSTATAVPASPAASGSQTGTPEEPSAAALAPQRLGTALAGADEPSIGDPMMAVVTGEGEPAAWTNALVAPLSLCFVDELVDRPCRIAVEVRGGAIASVAVEPFDGADRRVVARTLEDAPAILGPAELRAWLAADRLLHRTRDAETPAEHDAAMPVGAFVECCTQARLEGLPVGGPDGTRHVRFSWTREVARPIDRQAFVDLGVAAGPSQGPASAPVTVVSFVDIGHGWGFGRASLAAWRAVLASHPRDVRLVVKLCPLAAGREIAAEAVHAAGAQGAFWPMLERVAADPERPTLDGLVAHARALGLDTERLRADLERRAFRDVVEIDQDHRLAMEIDALPHALVNGRRLHGALPAATCLDAVEQALRGAIAAPG